MSQKSLLALTNPVFFKKIIRYHGFNILNDDEASKSDHQYYIEHFQDHNYLVDLNQMFSKGPTGDLLDRTGTLTLPFNFEKSKPWTVPDQSIDQPLEDILELRVQQILASNQNTKFNLFWSGGIDSTTMVCAFLMYCTDVSNLRIVYSPMSMKENPHFFLTMTTIEGLELHDLSGENYFSDLRGINVTGDVADEITASLDESFFNSVGYKGLIQPWEDFFKQQDAGPDLIEFCKIWFARSGMDIHTLLQARWWFYNAAKYHLYHAKASVMTQTVAFFDMTELDHYVAKNLDQLVTAGGYHTYKQFFKDFIFKYDKNQNYNRTKTKTNSYQILEYRKKRLYLQDTRYIAVLSDGTKISTPNLPLLSETEYRSVHGDTLEYLFNKKALAKHLFLR